MKEERLIEVLLLKVNKLTMDEANIEPGLANAITKFTAIVRTTNSAFNQNRAFHEYATYVLKSGTDFEKTRLIRNISSKLAIHNRIIIDTETSD